MPERTDAQLLQGWADGDAAAGSELVARHFSRVFRFFKRKAQGNAEDLTQKTFEACHKSLERLRAAQSFRAFILGIARNVWLQDARGQGRRQLRHAEAAREPVRSVTSPSGAVAAREEHHLLLRAIRTLPLGQQLVLELLYWEQLTTAEIGEVLEIPQGTVKWRLSQARTSLREALESMDADDALRSSTVSNLESWARGLREILDAQDDKPSASGRQP